MKFCIVLELQLKNTKCAIVKNRLKNLLNKLRRCKFATAFAIELKKTTTENDETKYSIFYSNSNVQIFINESNIDNTLESIYNSFISKIATSWKRIWFDYRFSCRSIFQKKKALHGSNCIKLQKKKRKIRPSKKRFN